ncbi:MAG: geranylgeranyl diphosphate synthase, type [Pseudonocardiales bacterium]|nr:geranylgeranyl diphosphate synthase, type [Pseudonocardiales bacterium]
MTARPLADSPPHPLDEQLVARVEAALAEYLAERRRYTETVHHSFTDAADALTGFVLGGGKRIRPTFAWWGWRGAGGQPDGALAEQVLRAVSALELVQASALVHDDLIDASDTRRGRPTVHVAYAARHRDRDWLGTADRFGLAAAVLIGDLALVWADDLFHSAELPEPVRERVRPVWAAMRTDLVGGQLLDVWGQVSGDDTAATALRVNRFKTAAYTVERPLQLGAALAGAPAELVDAYSRFGADIGVAFQLRDDMLGVFGDPEVTGKPAGDDLREGKRTLLMALAMKAARERGDGAALTLLTEALGDPGLDADGVDRVREALCELGTSDVLEQRIEQLTESALAALAGAEVAEPAATRLPELAHAATRRLA